MEKGATKYFANLANLVKVGYRSNAFAPLVWFNSIIDPLLLIIAYLIKGIVCYILIGIVGIIVLFSLIMYLVLFLKNPHLLQSERYRLEDRKLDLIASKGSDVMINPVDITPQQYIEEKSEGGNHE